MEPLEGITFAPAPESDISDFDELDDIDESSDGKTSPVDTTDEQTLIGENEAKKRARDGSLEKLQGHASEPKGKEKEKEVPKDKIQSQSTRPRLRNSKTPEGIIVLREEKVTYHLHLSFSGLLNPSLKASTFHDFLKFIYPQ